MSQKDKQKQRMHERIQKKSIQESAKEIIENNKLKRVEVDVITSFIKEEVYIQVYIDNNHDSAEDRVIGFR